MRKFYTPLFLLLTPLILSAQIDHWESLVLPGDSFYFLLPNTQPSDDWKSLDLNVDAWNLGVSGFGYGDQDDATEVPSGTISVYFRTQFEVLDANDIESIILDMDFDDSFIAYINGVEIARAMISGSPPGYDQFSDGLHEAQLYQGLLPERYFIDPLILATGTNVLAVEVHNESSTSSDLTAIPILSVGLKSATYLYRSTPDWFVIPPVSIDFYSSNLPIVLIETGGQEIPNEPRISAGMKIIYKEGEARNYLSNVNNPDFLSYEGEISIEVRGSSSQALEKKQYALTTYENGNTVNVSLLGMPKENDWVLNGLAYDPSLIRDYLSYNLSRQMGNYAPRTKYCELVLNGSYVGLYILQERIKADDSRVDINKIELSDNTLPKLSGGYITKSDKTENEVASWSMSNYGGWSTDFIHVTPKTELASAQQTDYIRGVFYDLAATSSANNTSLSAGYPSIIDIPSFIDFMLINELASNVDAYQFSTYFHKDRNGKLRAGPIWDFNLTYGNDLFLWGYDRSHTDIWQFFDGNMGAKFWKDLYDSPKYKCYMAKRWNQLTQPNQPLNIASLNTYIDQIVEEISEAVGREEERWGTVGTHYEHIYGIKAFLQERSVWMTGQLGSFSTCNDVPVLTLVITKIHYNPLETEDYSSSAQEFLEITNSGSSSIDLTGVYIGDIGLSYQFPPATILEAGKSIYLANETEMFQKLYGFLPFDEFARNLSDGGQSIKLLDGFGNVIDLVSFTDELPWPIGADGAGDYLELIDIDSDNNDPINWRSVPVVFAVLGNQINKPVLELFPNPSTHYVEISSPFKMNSVTIFDLQGRVLKIQIPEANDFSLNLSELPQGLYLIEVQTEYGVYTRKLKKE